MYKSTDGQRAEKNVQFSAVPQGSVAVVRRVSPKKCFPLQLPASCQFKSSVSPHPTQFLTRTRPLTVFGWRTSHILPFLDAKGINFKKGQVMKLKSGLVEDVMPKIENQ